MVLERVTYQILPYSATCYIVVYYLILSSTISYYQLAYYWLACHQRLGNPLYLISLQQSSSPSSPQLSILIQQQSTSFGSEAFIRACHTYSVYIVLQRSYSVTALIIDMRRVYIGYILITQLTYFIIQLVVYICPIYAYQALYYIIY